MSHSQPSASGASAPRFQGSRLMGHVYECLAVFSEVAKD